MVRIFANSDMYDLKVFTVFIKMDVIMTFQFSVKKTKWEENLSILEDFSFQKRHTVWLFMKTNLLKVGIHTSIDVWWLK